MVTTNDRVCRVYLVSSSHIGWPWVQKILQGLSWTQTAGESADPDEALRAIATLQPDAAIVDIRAEEGRTPELAVMLRRHAQWW